MLVAGKGHHHVVDAIARLRTRYDRLRLVIIGGGAHDLHTPNSCSARSTNGNCQESVRLTGAQPPETVARWLQAADVFALSTYDEGCCNAILEAMACGLPVVTTPAGDNATLVAPPRRGFIVPTGWSDALCEALETALRATWDRESIASYAADYSWEEVARRTARFFRQQIATTELHPDVRHGAQPVISHVSNLKLAVLYIAKYCGLFGLARLYTAKELRILLTTASPWVTNIDFARDFSCVPRFCRNG